jgi:hypothetical protein
MKYTIVTAFYLIQSKFTPDKYKEWISNFLQLKMNCIIFTNLYTKKWLETCFGKVLSSTNFKIEVMEMEDFITYKYDWDKQYDMDNEKYHTKELYMIWNEKINFLKIAYQKNPFQTKWFLWCDMGSLRQKIFFDQNFKSSNILSQLDQSKTYFFRIFCEYHNNTYFINNLKKYDCEGIDLNIVQGGFILTNLESCNHIHLEFYDLLNKLYDKGLFIGKDQCCYLSMVRRSKYTKVLEIVNHIYSNTFKDVWFFVYPFMLGLSFYREVNFHI